MPLSLRAGLSWCVCARQAVFLDLKGDRYFRLPETLDGLFQRWAAGEEVVTGDLAPLVARGILEPGDRGPVPPARHVPAIRDFALGNKRRAPLRHVIAAIGSQLCARRALKRHSIASVVARLVAESLTATDLVLDETRHRSVASAFAASGMVLRAADECLPRAIAARRMCQRQGLDTALIFGVRLSPFAAHSWVQAGDAVIVGDLENVRLYTPILVLP
ncbi:lasso peptide biosynthesis B2 protein [Sphingomonas sp. HF-S3]|uniref:Lasso peptide biosynthesis B2 protein n=1 Tax=Sphingomonas rustica TaxID=3103142 RepID=A0ABV0B3C1_9SPHN